MAATLEQGHASIRFVVVVFCHVYIIFFFTPPLPLSRPFFVCTYNFDIRSQGQGGAPPVVVVAEPVTYLAEFCVLDGNWGTSLKTS